MDFEIVKDQLGELFSQAKVTSDFFRYLKEERCWNDAGFECVVSGCVHHFDLTTEVEIVTRVAQFNYRPSSTEFRILLAIGGVQREYNGIAEARHFFAKIYYGEESAPFRVEMDSCSFSL